MDTLSKKSGATRQKIPPFPMRQRKDKVNGLETRFSGSQLSVPPRARPFLHNSFPNEQTLFMNKNVSIAKRLDCCLVYCKSFSKTLKERRKIVRNVKGNVRKTDFRE